MTHIVQGFAFKSWNKTNLQNTLSRPLDRHLLDLVSQHHQELRGGKIQENLRNIRTCSNTSATVSTLYVLNILADISEQIVLLLLEQSDQDLHSLSFYLYLLDTLLHDNKT